MISPAKRQPYLLQQRVLVGLWMLHATIWLALAGFPWLLRAWVISALAEARLGSNLELLDLAEERAELLLPILNNALLLCGLLCTMALLWGFNLRARKRWAWIWSTLWLAFEFVALCGALPYLIALPNAKPLAEQTPVDRAEPWFAGLMLGQVFLIGTMPFIQGWARRAFTREAVEVSNAEYLQQVLERLKGRVLVIIEIIQRRRTARRRLQGPTIFIAPPLEVPTELERGQFWPTRPLPPADDQQAIPEGQGHPTPDPDHLRS